MSHKNAIAATLVTIAVVGLPVAPFAATPAPVPCEKTLAALKTAIKDAKLSDADTAKIADLQGKGLERCKADDDAGADGFFSQAMTLLGK